MKSVYLVLQYTEDGKSFPAELYQITRYSSAKPISCDEVRGAGCGDEILKGQDVLISEFGTIHVSCAGFGEGDGGMYDKLIIITLDEDEAIRKRDEINEH